MTFKDLYDRIGRKIRFNNPRQIEETKDAINEQIMDFCRMKEWENTKELYVLTLTGANSYNLNTILTNRCVVLEILDSAGENLYKYDYKVYLRLTDKSKAYAIYGSTLYLEGTTGDYTMQYTSFGGDTGTDMFPLDTDDDEINVTIHYWDLIMQMVIVFLLESLGDTGTIELERTRLNSKMRTAKDKENRERNSGKFHHVQRP